jgi:hypothetical protein
MIKWIHLAHYSRIYYFLSPTFPSLPAESGGEAGGGLKKSFVCTVYECS